MAKRKKKSSSGIARVSTAALQKELERRQSKFLQVKKTRDALIAKVLELDDELKLLASEEGERPVSAAPKATRAGGSRLNNKLGLAESLAEVLKGKTMTVSEAAAAVKKAGYKTNAVNFRVMVNQAFIKNKNLFRKVKHGHYTTA